MISTNGNRTFDTNSYVPSPQALYKTFPKSPRACACSAWAYGAGVHAAGGEGDGGGLCGLSMDGARACGFGIYGLGSAGYGWKCPLIMWGKLYLGRKACGIGSHSPGGTGHR